jgi:xanthine dehydrogenase accessory factor
VICDSFPAAIEQIHPDEQDFVAIVTRGHKHDADCIRTLYASGITPAYMGLIGSKRRVAGLFENLCTEGIDRSFLDQIHTPIGLAIGAVTTDEIAISILSELILCRSRLSLWKKNGILEQTNLDPVFLNALHTEGPKAIAVVVDRKGSTPVKTGAIMCVNALGQSFGTIGGGCGEHEVLRKALEVLSDKKDMFLSVDMTNDFAGEEGMVCGGTMDVIIRYVPGKVEI